MNRLFYTCVLQSSLLHSRPKSTVGTPAYIAPEVLSRHEYDGKVILYSYYNPLCVVLSSAQVRRIVMIITSLNRYTVRLEKDIDQFDHVFL